MVAKMVKMMMAALLIFGGSLYAAGDGAGGGGGHKRGRDVAAMAVALIALGHGTSAPDGGEGQGDEDGDGSDDRDVKKKKQAPGASDAALTFRSTLTDTPQGREKGKVYSDVTAEEREKIENEEAVTCRECGPPLRITQKKQQGVYRVVSALQKHFNDHHKEKHQYSCGTCRWSADDNRTLTKHLRVFGHHRSLSTGDVSVSLSTKAPKIKEVGSLSSSSSSSTTLVLSVIADTHVDSSSSMGAGVSSSSLSNLYNTSSTHATHDNWIDKVLEDDQ